MALASGEYFITNSEFSKSLSLHNVDSTATHPVTSPDENSRWKIEQQGPERYTIAKLDDFATDRYCRFRWPPQAKERVECGTKAGTAPPQEWIIKEAPTRKSYMISPSDDPSLFWGIEADTNGTEVVLAGQADCLYKNWNIHSAPIVVERIIENANMEFEWINTTADPFNAQMKVTLEGGLPRDSYITFPTPLRMIWEGNVVGEVRISGMFHLAPYHVNKTESNALIVPGEEGLVRRFIQSLLMKKYVTIEVVADEVTVFASGKVYANVKIDFRRKSDIEGFDSFKDVIFAEDCLIQQNKNGTGVETVDRIQFKNPTNVGVEILEIPAEKYYKEIKIGTANFNPPFTLYPKSWERATFRENVFSSFCPSRPKEELCLEFIRDYITTNRPLTLNYNLIGTKIKLGSTQVPLSPFRTDVLFKGINKKFLHGATAYIPLTRILFSKKVAFKFEFENPIQTELKIVSFEAEAKRKGAVWCIARGKDFGDMTIQADKPETSPLIKGKRWQIPRSCTLMS